MKMSKFLSLFLLLISTTVIAQKPLRVKVLDSATKQPLSNAVIRDNTAKITVLTDLNGTFDGNINNTITVSFIGYTSSTLTLLPETKEILLNPSPNTLQDVVITATRNNILQHDLPQKASVITSQQIENTVAKDLTDVLKKNTGVDVIQYPNMLSGVGIRGFRPQFSGINQRTLLLIDGRPAGATNLATIDLTNVERIEVVKGAASALYGSQAMGGVLNVITKKSRGEINKTLSAGYGSYNTLDLSLQAGGSLSSRLDFNVALRYYDQRDDIRWGNDNFFRNKKNYTTVTNTYRDKNFHVDSVKQLNDVRGDGIVRPYTSYQYSLGSLRLGYDIAENWRVDIGTDYFGAANVLSPGDFFDGTTNQASKNPYRYSSYATVSGRIKNHNLTGKWYSSNEMSDYVPKTSAFATSKTTTTYNGFQFQDNFHLRFAAITVGVDRNKAIAKSQSFNATTAAEIAPSSPPYGIYSTAGFINIMSTFFNEKLIVTAAGRYDGIDFDVKQNPYLLTYKAAKSSYGVFSPGLGIKYKSPLDIDLHASYGKAFVTPDAFNVAGYSVAGPGASPTVTGKVNLTTGNPDLKPERSTSWDAGISYFKKEWGIDVDLTYFSTAINDRITTSPTTPVPAQLTAEGDTVVSTTTYINADNSHMRGLELGAAFDLGAFSDYDYSLRLFFNTTRFFTLEEMVRDKTFTTETVFRSRNITNVAASTTTYGLEYAKNGLATRLSGRYVGKRYDTDNTDLIKRPEIEYAKFMVLDFSIVIPARKKDKIICQVNNLTDENYYEKRGYNLPGRNFKISYAVSL
jgi:vitamin B12 transporter